MPRFFPQLQQIKYIIILIPNLDKSVRVMFEMKFMYLPKNWAGSSEFTLYIYNITIIQLMSLLPNNSRFELDKTFVTTLYSNL